MAATEHVRVLAERDEATAKLEAAVGRVRELEAESERVRIVLDVAVADRVALAVQLDAAELEVKQYESHLAKACSGCDWCSSAPEAAKPLTREEQDEAMGEHVEANPIGGGAAAKPAESCCQENRDGLTCDCAGPASPPSQAAEPEQTAGEQPKYSRGQQVWYRWGHNAAPLLCTVKGGKRLGGYDVLGPDNVLRIAHEDNLTACSRCKRWC